MKLAYRAFHPSDWTWINSRIHILGVEDTAGLMAVDTETNKLVAAVIFDNWTPNSAQVHMVVDKPMVVRHGFVEAVFEFAFIQCKLNYLYGFVPEDNTMALKVNRHLGFTEKIRMPDAWAKGVDYIFMEMKKDNCKYIPEQKEVA